MTEEEIKKNVERQKLSTLLSQHSWEKLKYFRSNKCDDSIFKFNLQLLN